MASPALTSLGIYRRRVRTSLERVWENVHDWEHLPWLHSSSFFDIELREAGDWGWRARIGVGAATAQNFIELELVREPSEPRYVSRTLEGGGAGSEIWTTVTEVGPEATDIEVEFVAVDVDPTHKQNLFSAYERLYTQLWDEDEGMMRRRTAQLVKPRPAGRPQGSQALGTLDEVRALLPLSVELDGRPYRILEVDGTLIAHATSCPHSLGPLDKAPIEHGVIRCPWHGYRFDLATRRCLDHDRLRLPPAPEVRVDPCTHQVQLLFA